MNHVVKKSIAIDAVPSQVWSALTDPQQTKKYFFGCTVFSEWKRGSAITFSRRFLFRKFELTGRIIEAVPGKLLKYTLHNRKGKGVSTVTDELQYVDGKTLLIITDDVGKEEGADKRFRRSYKAWDKVLAGLKKVVEKKRNL